jgi:hypothetical protein
MVQGSGFMVRIYVGKSRFDADKKKRVGASEDGSTPVVIAVTSFLHMETAPVLDCVKVLLLLSRSWSRV